MPTPAVVEIVTTLLLTVSQLSNYPAPRELPPIHVLSERELIQRLCQGPCGIQAFYLDGQGIFLRDDLDIVGDLKARSILLHELVHHAQHESGRFGSMSACERWLAREDEAYRIQNAYLSRLRTSLRFFFDYVPDRCRDSDPVRN